MVRRRDETTRIIVVGGGGLPLVLVMVVLAVAATLYLVHFGPTLHPFAPHVTGATDARPAILHAIQGSDQLVTAEREVDQEITKSAGSRLPGSTETVTYLAVYDVLAGVDLSRITEDDITIDGDTVRIRLPPPYVISQALDAQESHVLARTEGPTAFIGGPSKDLMDAVLRDAQDRAKTATLADGTLLAAAQENAASDLRRLLSAVGYTHVVFEITAPAVPPASVAPAPVTPTPHR